MSGRPDRIAKPLGLVAKALLVAIGLHALAALMLANLGLPTFFEVAHNLRCSWFELSGS